MQGFLNRLIPLLLTACAIAAFIFGIILLAYFLLFCAIAGAVIYCILWIRNKFFPPKVISSKSDTKPTGGRIIDTDDWKNL